MKNKDDDLFYLKWYATDARLINRSFEPDEVVEIYDLVFGTEGYLVTGVKPDIEPNKSKAFRGTVNYFFEKVDLAREAREEKSSKYAQNGSQGGKKKAENRRASAPAAVEEADSSSPKKAATFTPPSKKAFNQRAFKIIEKLIDFEYRDEKVPLYDIEEYYSELKGKRWRVFYDGAEAEIKSSDMLDGLIYYRFLHKWWYEALLYAWIEKRLDFNTANDIVFDIHMDYHKNKKPLSLNTIKADIDEDMRSLSTE